MNACERFVNAIMWYCTLSVNVIAKLSRTKNNGHNARLVIISTRLVKLAWEGFPDVVVEAILGSRRHAGCSRGSFEGILTIVRNDKNWRGGCVRYRSVCCGCGG